MSGVPISTEPVNTPPVDVDALRERLLALEQLGRGGAGAAATPAKRLQSAVLELGGETFAIPLARVEALLRSPEVVPVPGAQPWLLGAVRVGQRMLALLDPHWVVHGAGAASRPQMSNVVVLGVDAVSIAVPVTAVHGVAGDAAPQSCAAVRELDLNACVQRLRGDGHDAGGTGS